MTVLITLTLAGADTGPFSLYSDVDGFLAPFEIGVSKLALEAGYTSVVVPNGSTIIRVQSNSACTNYIDLNISGITTTTTTSTSTSTSTSTTSTTTTAGPVVSYQYGLYGYADSSGEACTQSGGSWVVYGPPQLQVYAASSTPGGVIQFFNDMALTTPFDDASAYNKYLSYSLASDPTNLYSGYYNSLLAISSQTDCVP